jgi:hypothetical protein
VTGSGQYPKSCAGAYLRERLVVAVFKLIRLALG